MKGSHQPDNSQGRGSAPQDSQLGRDQPQLAAQRGEAPRAAGASQSGQSQKAIGQRVNGQKSGRAPIGIEVSDRRHFAVKGQSAFVSQLSE